MDTDVELDLTPAPGAPDHRRGSRWILVALAALCGVVAAALAVVPDDDSEPDEVVLAAGVDDTTTTQPTKDESSTTTVEITTTTAVETTTTVAITAAPTTTAPRRTTTTTAAAPPTTSTTLACRNSTDPACGPFYWDPAPPPNQQLTISFVDLPSRWNSYYGGLYITFEYHDPDSFFIWAETSYDGTSVVRDCSWAPETPRYGPWTPPEPTVRPPGARYTMNAIWFPEPGVYEVRLGVGTGFCDDPWHSFAELRATIEVYDEPPPPPPEEPPPAEG